MNDDEMPVCRCETCVDHRMRIRREVNRLREHEKQRGDSLMRWVRRFINDQEDFHNRSVLRGGAKR